MRLRTGFIWLRIGSSEHGNESDRQFPKQLSEYQLLKSDSA
jgi:hypothetical protein